MEKKVEKYLCPVCQTELPGKPYLLNCVCPECRKKTVSSDGRPLIFFTLTGGRYADTNAPYDSPICFIDGVKCRAVETSIGAIVIEKCVTLEERIRGGIVGLLVGDALGVPYEFHPPESIPPFEEIEFQPPDNFARAHQGVLPGTWSDDGAQALCLLASLLECGKFNAADFAEKLVAWFQQDYMTVDGVFDIGVQTQRALLNLRKGVPPLEAGLREEKNNGNGSLMRVLPLALWHRGTNEEMASDAFAQSAITHGHLRSQLCCALYCLLARNILLEIRQPYQQAEADLKEIFRTDAAAKKEIQVISDFDWQNLSGSGYVVDSMLSAVDCFWEPSYEETVKKAISYGNDTDTTAAIAGGIAGLRFGVNGIPERWRENLRGREIYAPLIEKLLERI